MRGRSFSARIRISRRKRVWSTLLFRMVRRLMSSAMSTVGSAFNPWVDMLLSNTLSGQFYDYLHLLSLTGEPSTTHSLLMNGDLVDRGSWSIEVILTALAFKCEYTPLDNSHGKPNVNLRHRALPQEHVHQPRKPRGEGDEPHIWFRGGG